MEHEALRQYLEARLHREDAQEVGLGRLLRKKMGDSHDAEQCLKTVEEVVRGEDNVVKLSARRLGDLWEFYEC